MKILDNKYIKYLCVGLGLMALIILFFKDTKERQALYKQPSSRYMHMFLNNQNVLDQRWLMPLKEGDSLAQAGSYMLTVTQKKLDEKVKKCSNWKDCDAFTLPVNDKQANAWFKSILIYQWSQGAVEYRVNETIEIVKISQDWKQEERVWLQETIEQLNEQNAWCQWAQNMDEYKKRALAQKHISQWSGCDFILKLFPQFKQNKQNNTIKS